MVSKRRRYAPEFKIKTVRLITDSDQSVSEVARDLDIHPNTLYKWIHQYGENSKEAFPGKGKQVSQVDDPCRLRKENQRLKMERDILKSDGHFLQRPEVVFRFMQQHQAGFPISVMCDVLSFSRSGYYAWLKKPVSKRQKANEKLREKICTAHHDCGQSYGSPRVY